MTNAKRDDNRVTALLGHSSTGPTASAWPVAVDNRGNLKTLSVVGDSPNVDAFSRTRVSNPVGVFDSTFQYDLQPSLYYSVNTNGATASHDANLSSAKLALTGPTGAAAVMQSKQYHRYIPAKSQLVVMTQVLGVATAGVVRRSGYFDTNDGVFLEQNGITDVAFVRRTSTSGSSVDNRVTQSNWNVDPLDGSGLSGVTLDLSKSQILVIDLQWLGMGRVRLGFDVDGKIVYAHEFLNANNLAVPYMKTANLPVRWEVGSTATGATGSLYATCASVISEGGNETDRGFPFSYANTTGTNAATGVRSPMLSIQPATTFNGLTNRIQVALEEFSGVVAGANPVLLELVYNTTVSGGTWNPVDPTSSVNYNNTVTATGVTGGTTVGSAFLAANNTSRSSLINLLAPSRMPITLDTSGNNPVSVTLYGTGLGGNATAYGGLSWQELR